MKLLKGLNLLALFLFSIHCLAQNFAIKTIQEKGHPESTYSLAIVAEGYTQSQMNLFERDAQKAVDILFENSAYNAMKEQMNIYAIGTVSQQEGISLIADNPSTYDPIQVSTIKNTYFNIHFRNSYRAHFFDEASVVKAQKIAATYIPYTDAVLILVNDNIISGRASIDRNVAVASRIPNASHFDYSYAAFALRHELGHAIAGLSDAYNSQQEEGFNKSTNNNPATIRWKDLLGQEGVGIHEVTPGSQAYIPNEQCIMNIITNFFCPVCKRRLHQVITGKRNKLPSPHRLKRTAIDIENSQIILKWDPIPNTMGYEISFHDDNGEVVYKKVAAGVTSATLRPKEIHFLSGWEANIRAFNTSSSTPFLEYLVVGDGYSPTPFAPPTNIQVTNKTTTSFRLSWTQAASAKNSMIRLYNQQGYFTEIYTDETSFEFKGLKDGGGYQVEIAAIDPFDRYINYNSSFSNKQSINLLGTGNTSCASRGGDSDGDGVCSDVDCNDNNPNVPTTPGTPCDDGNFSTINDQISADGCTCVGIIEPPSVPSCLGIQNALYREVWQGVGGSTIADLERHTTYPDNPTTSGTIIGGVVPDHIGDYYGQRIRGFIQAPQTGEYQFNITGDDGVDVFLGTSAEPSSQVKIAEVDGWTSLNQHNRYSEQTSERISLTAGQYYYLEILHKEGEGGDHVTLFWKTPATINSSQWVRVPGVHFWSYGCGDTSIMPCNIDTDRDGICAEDDCDDFDANVGRRQTRGTSCDDGNFSTTNDRISGDGCSCIGTPSIIEPPSIPSCLGIQNTLYREVWEGIGGSTIADLERHTNYPDNPTTSGTIIGGVIRDNIGNYYGQRIRGYIQAPQTGEYQFNITGDDDVDVFIGRSAEPSSQVKIAEVNGWTSLNQHDKYDRQTSERISLTAGQYYYLEILHKEGGGGDHVTLFWKTPATIGSSEWGRVPGDRFWSYDCGDTSIIPCSIDADRDGICAADDCDDFDARVGRRQTRGTLCDDGNFSTENDRISGDGCSCIGTPSIIEPPSVPSCVGTQNTLLREVWQGVGGSTIADLERHTTYPDNPTTSGTIIGGVIRDNIGNDYGQRIRGFIQAPQSGEYQFNITGDDDVDVFLGTSAEPSSQVKIAEVNGWTNPNQHNRYSEQTSRRIHLTAGQYYYLEILHKEGGGGDHLTLFWKTPSTISSNSNQWVRVPGVHFWSYDCSSNTELLIEESCEVT